jgi:hypothetical protein
MWKDNNLPVATPGLLLGADLTKNVFSIQMDQSIVQGKIIEVIKFSDF